MNILRILLKRKIWILLLYTMLVIYLTRLTSIMSVLNLFDTTSDETLRGPKRLRSEVKVTKRDELINPIKSPIKVVDLMGNKNENSPDLQNTCQLPVDLKQSRHADVFTYDLPDITNYTMITGKRFREYAIPVMTEKEAAYGPYLDPVTVLVIPFSHVDPGYGNTMEGYYRSKTKGTLDNMIIKLDQYRNFTFQWAETVFLERWWRDLDAAQKNLTREAIQRGQLEIVLGGWVMPDEASTHYVSVVDQLIEGHQWVLENLGTKPKNSWSNDPFGFSSTMPYLWKKSGIDNMVILRIHQAVKGSLMKLKTMEFNWRQLWSTTNANDILCHLMPYRGYWIGDVCGPYNQHICREYAFMREAPIHKVIFVTKENIAERARILYEQYRITAEIYRRHGNNDNNKKNENVELFLPMFLGEDFSYNNAREYDLIYQQFTMLFDYINAKPDWKMKIKFGTLAQYFSLLRDYQNKRSATDNSGFPTLSGDFFPYSDYQNDYWTGYYTTRPFNKQISRELQSSLRLGDILHSYAFAVSKTNKISYNKFKIVSEYLRDARRELGMFLHHDGITGTSVSHVINDFQERLFSSLTKAKLAIKTTVAYILGLNADSLKYTTNRQSKISISVPVTSRIPTTGSALLVSNPSGRARKEIVTITTNSYVQVKDSENGMLKSDCIKDKTNRTFVSFEIDLPPFGIETFHLLPINMPLNRQSNTISENDKFLKVIELRNEYMKAEFGKDTGLLTAIVNADGQRTSITTEILAYTSDRSGAYIFEPTGKAKSYLDEKPEIKIFRGKLYSEITTIYKGFRISYTIYSTSGVQGHGLHMQTHIDIKKNQLRNKEIIVRLRSSIESNNLFYTDQNGFQLLGRKTYTDRPIEQNYYPMTTMILIEDESSRLTLHAAQPHGVASLESGWIEVMLDRTMDKDDNKGVGQGVNDNIPAVADFVIQVETARVPFKSKDVKYTFPTETGHLLNDILVNPVYQFHVDSTNEHGKLSFRPMKQDLPSSLTVTGMRNLVNSNLEYTGTSLTLHNKAAHCAYTSNLKIETQIHQISLETIFPGLTIKSSKETKLTHLHDIKRVSLTDDITPSPMELKSLIINF